MNKPEILKRELIRWKNNGEGQPCCNEICQEGVFKLIDKIFYEEQDDE